MINAKFVPIYANNNEESIINPVPHVKRGVEPILKSDITNVLTVPTSNV